MTRMYEVHLTRGGALLVPEHQIASIAERWRRDSQDAPARPYAIVQYVDGSSVEAAWVDAIETVPNTIGCRAYLYSEYSGGESEDDPPQAWANEVPCPALQLRQQVSPAYQRTSTVEARGISDAGDTLILADAQGRLFPPSFAFGDSVIPPSIEAYVQQERDKLHASWQAARAEKPSKATKRKARRGEGAES